LTEELTGDEDGRHEENQTRAPKKGQKRAPPEVERRDDEPISLHPLTVEEALAAALKVPWPQNKN